jgi:hypothetical protein
VFANVELQYNTRLVTVEPGDYAEECGEGTWEVVKDFDPTMEEDVFLDFMMPLSACGGGGGGRHGWALSYQAWVLG